MTQKDDDIRRIEELIGIMKANDLTEIEIKHGEDKIFLKRSPPQLATTAVGMVGQGVGEVSVRGVPLVNENQKLPVQQAEGLIEIKSPLVGTFYAQPSPESEPYVEMGSHVSLQTVVCMIEAMKVMNEIKAEVGGIVTEILVTNGQAVEYGQVLFRVKTD
jgi:acetyl-CoA carboxylase biotin carboxyl carrier protein